MDFWQRARTFAEDTARKSQELTLEAARRSSEFTIGSSKISDIVSETAKKSKDFAVEATKKADQIKIEALKRADQIKTLAENISPQLPNVNSISLVDSSSSASAVPSDEDLEKFGVTDDLREFVKGITQNTFQDFPIQDEPEISDVPTVSNVRQDLTEWQEKHATLVLLTVKEISKLRYQLCPRFMKERKFWKIYFILVNSHVAPYEKRYTEELKSAETVKGVNTSAVVGSSTKPEATTQAKLSKTSTSSEQDLDVFLLGDLGSDDDGPDDGDGGFDDDFDNLEDEDEKLPKK
ncbi:hypothetical protein ACHQM5_006737 [Ranunculus cassubicifolius]